MKLTKQMLAGAEVIARGHRIRELGRLLRLYGGSPRGWIKMKTKPMRDSEG